MRDGTHRIVLTIAGSDSGAGAGIQADLKTFAAFDCYGTCVVTAVTAQNTLGVAAVHPIPPDMVAAQLDALASDLPPVACKTGMLATAANVAVVADAIGNRRWPYVLDPVMTATTGAALLADEAVAMVRDQLVPLAWCVTPNLDEAERLTGFPVRDPDAMERAGRALVDLGAAAALVKGGHLETDELIDVLVTADATQRFVQPRTATRGLHGTGCTLSAALVALLAHGYPVDTAVSRARDYVQRAIRAAPGLGAGTGPLGHRPPGAH